MKKRHAGLYVLMTGIIVLLGGCGNGERDATEAALQAAQTAIKTSQGATEKIVPEQIQAAQESLQTAKAALAKGDYAAALNAAREATKKTKDAVAEAAAKKEEWTKTWDRLNASAPRSLADIQIKLDAYKKYGRLPKGVASEQMESAQPEFDDLKQGWADAKTAYKSGNLLDAMKKAYAFSEGLQKLKDQVGIQPQ